MTLVGCGVSLEEGVVANYSVIVGEFGSDGDVKKSPNLGFSTRNVLRHHFKPAESAASKEQGCF